MLFKNKGKKPSKEILKQKNVYKISIILSIVFILFFGIFVLFKFDVFNLRGTSYKNVTIKRSSVSASQFNKNSKYPYSKSTGRDWNLYIKNMEKNLPYVVEAARKHNVDPAVIMGIIMAETNALSKWYGPTKYGACGIMQVIAKGYKYGSSYTCSQLKNDKTGIMAGTSVYKSKLNTYKTELKAICRYYGSSSYPCNYSKKVYEYIGIVRKLYIISTGTNSNPNSGNTTKTNTTTGITLNCPSTLKVNTLGKCTTNLSGVKISITKTNLASGYSTSFTTKSKDKVKNLKYTKPGTVTVTATKSGYKTVTKKVNIVANATTTTTKSTTKATSSNQTLTLKQGQKITLSKAPLYISSTSTKNVSKNGKSGTYYIWSAVTKNGRVRITTKASYVGKSGRITGWINIKDIK